jgi:hypothetical protein
MTPRRITAPAVGYRLAAPLALVLGVVIAGCSSAPVGPVLINTSAPSTIYLAARVGGILRWDSTYGLGFKNGDKVIVAVWPNGYSARREQDSVVVLIDPTGRIVAREEDHIFASGGYGETAEYVMCDLEVAPLPPSDMAAESTRSVQSPLPSLPRSTLAGWPRPPRS